MTAFFSGEPLPIAPPLTYATGAHSGRQKLEEVKWNEQSHFNVKLLEYLRRLGLHLSNPDVVTPSSNPAVQVMCLYRDTSDQTLTSAGGMDNIEWNGQIRIDAPFNHDKSTAALQPDIDILVDGFYLMFIDLWIDSGVTYEIQVIDADDSSILSWSKGGVGAAIGSFGTTSYVIPIHGHSGQTFNIQVDVAGNSNLEFDRTRLTIMRIGDLIGGGESPIDPCILEPWQLYC